MLMWYNLGNPFEVQTLRTRMDKMIQDKAMIEVVEKKPRSLKANAYLHAIMAYFGLQTGNTAEEVKREYYKRAANYDIFVRVKHDPLLNINREYLRSVADLTQDELSVSIDRFRTWCSGIAGIYIPSSDEHIALLHMQHDIEQAKRFL